MVTRTVTYTDIDGVERTKDLYFHLTKAEFVKMENSSDPLSKRLTECVGADGKPKDIEKMLEVIERILLAAYGVREGTGFRKSKELTEQFAVSEEYSQLFMDMLDDPNILVEIFKGITPNIDTKQSPVQQKIIPYPPSVYPNVGAEPRTYPEVPSKVYSQQEVEAVVREVLAGMQNANAAPIVK